MSCEETRQSTVYKDTLKAVQDIDPPAVGFEKTDGSLGPSLSKQLKQNNFLIQLLVKTFEEIQGLRFEIESLNSKLAQSKGKLPATELDNSIEALQKQLEQLTIRTESEPEKPRKKRPAPFFVFKDPLAIYKEELAKIKK